MRTALEILRRAVAAVVLVVVVVGVPWSLSRFGVPIPTRLPTFGEVRALLDSNRDPEEVILIVGGSFLWFLWGVLVVLNLVAAVGVACQLRFPNLRLAGSLHPITRSVLTSLTIAVLSGFPRPLAANASTSVAWSAKVAVVTPDLETLPATSPGSSDTSNDIPRASEYTVVAGDTLWGIAEHELGDPYRWREIQVLNEGRAQPDGRALVDPGLIYPGWTLQLPASAVYASPAYAPIEPPQLQDPGLVTPDTSLTEPAPTTPNRLPAAPAERPRGGETRPSAPDSSISQTLPLGIAGSVIALAVVTTLTARRRKRFNHRQPGEPPPRPEPRLVPIEMSARTAAEQVHPDRLDRTLRTLTAPNGRVHPRHAAPVAVEVRKDTTVVMLNQPDLHPPRGWTAIAPGWLWTLPHASDLDALEPKGRGRATPMPTLVTIGRGQDGEVMLDLEACGLVCIAGDHSEAHDLVRSAALELCLGARAQNVGMLTTDPTLAGALPKTTQRLSLCANVDDAVRALHQHAQEVVTAQCTTDNTLAAQGATSDESSPVVLILPAVPDDPQQRMQLEQLVGNGRAGIAVLAIGSWPAATWTLHIDEGILDVPRLGLAGLEPVLDAQAITAEAAEHVAELLDAPDEPAVAASPCTNRPFDHDEPCPDESSVLSPEIEVRVLGDVDVIGGARALTATEKELVTFLALRGQPVDADTIQAALWPNTLPAPKRWWNVVSETRRALGTASDGEPHLPAVSKGERLYLRPTVVADVDQLGDRLHAASTLPTSEAIDSLIDALAQVSGRPFTASRGYAWAHASGIVSHAEAVVVDATHRLVLLLLDAGDATAALAATNVGLRAAPCNEALYRDRMLAHNLSGNLSGIEAEFGELCRALDVTKPRTQLHPETLKLYDQLTGTISDTLA